LIRAGTRSESLAARRAALSYFEQANGLTDEPVWKAALLTRAANMPMDGGLLDRGGGLNDGAIDTRKELAAEWAEAGTGFGRGSESLAARRAALSYFEPANELTDEPVLKADLLTRAANMAMDAGLLDRGRELYDRAIDITKELGDEVGEARIEIRRAFMATADGLLEDSMARMVHAHGILSKYPPGPDLAEAAA